MDIFALIGIAVIAAILSLTLKKYNPEYAAIMSIVAGVFLLFKILPNVTSVFNELKNLISNTGVSSEYLMILFKSLGIAFFTQFSSDSCNDVGQTALALKIELAGKIMILIVSLPLFSEVMSVITKLMR